MNLRQILAFVPVVAFGCSRTPQVDTVPAPIPESKTSPVPSTGPVSWTISPGHYVHRYRSSVEALVELTDSAGPVQKEIKSTTDFSLSVTRGPEVLSYTASVDSIIIDGGTTASAAATGGELPFTFTAHLREGQMTIDSGQPAGVVTDCSHKGMSSIPIVQRAVVSVPILLRRDMTWTDSTTATICTGSIPAISTTVRSYRILGAVPGGVLIERRDRTTAVGEGAQEQHLMRMRSEGSGTAQLVIDSSTGALRESRSSHTTSVAITASGRDRRFTQTTRELIVMR
jgi:hypothetical protein